MRYFIVVFIILFITGILSAQPKIPLTGKDLKSFIPKGWKLTEKKKCDLNNDRISDYVMVFDNEKLVKDFPQDADHILVIVNGTGKRFIRTGLGLNLYIPKVNAGVSGSGYDGFLIKTGNIIIKNYSGSSFKFYSEDYFKFINNKWLRVKSKLRNFHSLETLYCEKLDDFLEGSSYTTNYVTGIEIETHVNEKDCIRKKTSKKIRIKKLISLEKFNVNEEYN